MLLITVTHTPTGYRLLATSTYQGRYYCWSLYRNGRLLQVVSRNYRGERSITFDLNKPLAPGHYELRVESFGWEAGAQPAVTDYRTDIVTVTTLA